MLQMLTHHTIHAHPDKQTQMGTLTRLMRAKANLN